MNTCNDCGGEMIGDGYTMVLHCEYAEDDTYWYNAPDDGPVYCGLDCDQLEVPEVFEAYKTYLKKTIERNEEANHG